jgi:hypothetical protein
LPSPPSRGTLSEESPFLPADAAFACMSQETLQTERITLVPLADEHLEWEVELDSDLEVMRHVSGRASTREEVAANHARRMAAAQKLTARKAP